MLDDGAAGDPRVLERAAEETWVLDRGSVIGEGDRTRRGELDQVGELAALPSASDRSDRQHSRTARRTPASDELGDEARRIDRGLGVGHGADRREPPVQGRLGAGLDRFGILESRLAQMCVEIDEARDDEVALRLERAPVDAHARSSKGAVAASRYKSAIRTATPFVTCVSMSERVPCATAASISTPSFIGPGCMTGAPGRMRATRSAVRPHTREYSRREGRSPDSWRSR